MYRKRAWRWGLAGGLALLAVGLWPEMAQAVSEKPKNVGEWIDELHRQLTDPLFWFGIGAQFLFFMRFIWQWIVSEKRRQSTIPLLFWYFSLAGGVSMFAYGCLRADLVIMLGQALACIIYTRNLMLIFGHADRRRRAGLPAEEMGSSVDTGCRRDDRQVDPPDTD